MFRLYPLKQDFAVNRHHDGSVDLRNHHIQILNSENRAPAIRDEYRIIRFLSNCAPAVSLQRARWDGGVERDVQRECFGQDENLVCMGFKWITSMYLEIDSMGLTTFGFAAYT